MNLVASNSVISTDTTKAVKFRSHADYLFECLSVFSYDSVLTSYLEKCYNYERQKFYIQNLEKINDILKPNEYPITDIKWIPDKEKETFLTNVKFEKFDNITWLIVNAKSGRCYTKHTYWDSRFSTYKTELKWMDCAKNEHNFPKHPTQRWDIENW